MSGIAYFRCETIRELRNITQAARRTQRTVSTSFSRTAARQLDSFTESIALNCMSRRRTMLALQLAKGAL